MPNPYASTGSVATVTSSIAGGADTLTPGGAGGVPPLSTATVVRRLAAYVRPHAALLILSFAAAAVSVVLQLLVPIQIGRAIDLIIGPGRVDFAALLALAVQLAAGTLVIFVHHETSNRCCRRLLLPAGDRYIHPRGKLFILNLSVL